MFFVSFSLGDSEVTANDETNSLDAKIVDGEFELTFDYSYQLLSWPYLSEEGSGAISASGLALELSGTAGRNAETGGMTYSILLFETTIEELSITLEGGILAGVVDLVVAALDDELGAVVETFINEILLEAVTAYGDSGLDFFATCDDGVCQDLRLGSEPEFASSASTVLVGGTYYAEDSAYSQPSGFTELPVTVDDHMLQVFLAPAVFGSFFAAVFAEGTFAPVESGPLAAADVAAALPEFAAAFPGAAAVATLELTAAPEAEILYSAIKVTFAAQMALQTEAGAAACVLQLSVVAAADVDFPGVHHQEDVEIHGTGVLTFEVSPNDISVSVASSSIGDIAVTDALRDWAEACFFDDAYDPVWDAALRSVNFNFVQLDTIVYVNRKVVYDPNYYAMLVDAVVYTE